MTTNWKCNSDTDWAVLLVNANNKLRLLAEATVLFASMSILRFVLLTTVLCSLGNDGVSVGKAEEKDHSSSSLAASCLGGIGVAGFELKEGEASAANGSFAAGFDGAAKTDCWYCGG